MIKKLVGLSILAALSMSANGDVWSERKALHQLKEEIAALRVLAQQAQSLSDDNQREVFQYHVLLDDLKAIENGIERHLTKPFEPVAQMSVEAVGMNYSKRKQLEESK